MDIEQYLSPGGYVLVPADADLALRRDLRRAAAERGLMALDQPRPSNETAARAERMAQRGVIEPTVAKHDQRAFLAQLERIAAGKVVVG